MLKSQYDPDVTEIYVLAGGSTRWGNDVMEEDLGGDNCGKIALYKLNPTDVSISRNTVIRMSDFELDGAEVSMGYSETLTSFIDYVTTNAEGDDYSLIMWDHGGGFSGGICEDQNYPVPTGLTEILEPDELYNALADSEFIKNGNRFSLLDFDACLMGQYEVAYSLSSFYQNMIGSSQTVNMNYGYENIIRVIDSYGRNEINDRTEFLGELLYSIASQSEHARAQGSYSPFTCFDSSSFEIEDSEGKTINERLEEFGTLLTSMLQYNSEAPEGNNDDANRQAIEVYRAVSRARALSTQCGNVYIKDHDHYVDMGELFYNLQRQIGLLAEENPGNEQYGNLLENINAVIAHLNNDNIAYLSAAYRDNGNLYKNDYVSGRTYQNAAEERLSDFARMLGISDKMLGISIYLPGRTYVSPEVIERTYGQLGMDNYGNAAIAYNNLGSSNRYSDEEGLDYNEWVRINRFQSYTYYPEEERLEYDPEKPKARFIDMADASRAEIRTYNNGNKDIKYIYIPLKSDEEYRETPSGNNPYSSGSVSKDYADTLGRIAVYVSIYFDGSAHGADYCGDLICEAFGATWNNFSYEIHQLISVLIPELTNCLFRM